MLPLVTAHFRLGPHGSSTREWFSWVNTSCQLQM
jgi:hypothetical protein